jgi:hypothetical protein
MIWGCEFANKEGRILKASGVLCLQLPKNLNRQWDVQLTLTLKVCCIQCIHWTFVVQSTWNVRCQYTIWAITVKKLFKYVSASLQWNCQCALAPSKVSFLDGAHSFLSSEVWNASSRRCFMTSSFDSLLGYRTQKFGSTEFRSTLVVSAWTSKIILQDLQPCRP